MIITRSFLLCFLLTTVACTHSPSRTLPDNDLIIKIKYDHDLGVIAESKHTTYYFTEKGTKEQILYYRDFLNDFKNDISGVSISFLQLSVSDAIYAKYVNYIPNEKVSSKKELF